MIRIIILAYLSTPSLGYLKSNFEYSPRSLNANIRQSTTALCLERFKPRDPTYLVGDILALTLSEEFISLFNTLTSPNFEGWDTPVLVESESAVLKMLFKALVIAGSFVSSGILQSSYSEPPYYFRSIWDALNYSQYQIVGMINVYLVFQLALAVIQHKPVDGIDSAVLSLVGAAVSTSAWRLAYGNSARYS